MTERPHRKVFCIGFHKTGTKSLAAALRTLGYRVTGPDWTLEPDIANRVLALATEASHRFDAFQDNPWPLLFREMDALHPGSRFILTSRAPQAWIRSVCAYFGEKTSPMREWIYGVGSPVGHEAVYLQRMQRHLDEVRDHFRSRPSDLFEMDVTMDPQWDGLCRFLERPVPPVPFPHLNRNPGNPG